MIRYKGKLYQEVPEDLFLKVMQGKISKEELDKLPPEKKKVDWLSLYNNRRKTSNPLGIPKI